MDTPFETEGIRDKLYDLFESDFWAEVQQSCLGCGVCTFLCPTCHCFDIVDEVQRSERVRNWDTCMFRIYSQEASGHNPRPTNVERTRQRIMHKYAYFLDLFQEIGCTGCGRCVRHCPVDLDIRHIIHSASAQRESPRRAEMDNPYQPDPDVHRAHDCRDRRPQSQVVRVGLPERRRPPAVLFRVPAGPVLPALPVWQGRGFLWSGLCGLGGQFCALYGQQDRRLYERHPRNEPGRPDRHARGFGHLVSHRRVARVRHCHHWRRVCLYDAIRPDQAPARSQHPPQLWRPDRDLWRARAQPVLVQAGHQDVVQAGRRHPLSRRSTTRRRAGPISRAMCRR